MSAAARTRREARREALVGTVAAILDKGEPTRFAFEGACRHGVRGAFILGAGWRWRDADTMAAAIIEEALRLLGVERPSWQAGQPEIVEPVGGPRLLCAQCGKPFPETAPQHVERRLYCSPVCASAAQTERRRVQDVQRTWAEELAHRAAQKEARRTARLKPCAVCGAGFAPRKPTSRFCSKSCAAKAANAARAVKS